MSRIDHNLAGHRTPATAGVAGAHPAATEEDDASGNGTSGTWVVVLAALCVVATVAANLVFFQGYLDIARLPGDIPPINDIPNTAATHTGRLMMRCGVGLYVLAVLLGVPALGFGIALARRAASFARGTWAVALVACTPVLTIMMLSGMGAS